MDCAINSKALLNASDNTERTMELHNEYRQYPERYPMWELPTSWTRGVELTTHIDVCMHLIFLGVVKTVIGMVQEWAKLRGKATSFLGYLIDTLDSLQDLGVDWCRCILYTTGKLGGWVSEKYLGASRVLHWMYGGIHEIAPDVNVEDPKKSKINGQRRKICIGYNCES